MKIGIVSDTHNSIEQTRKAVAVFKEAGVDLVLHSGDLTSPRMLELFTGLNCRFVLGNGDIDIEDLNAESERLGFGPIEYYSAFEAGGRQFIMFHGNNVPLFREAVASGKYDYIIKGHTHFFENYLSNSARVINPGSLYGANEFSIAILDVETDRVEMIRISEDE